MENKNQDMHKTQNSKESTEKLHKKIKETWPSLSDDSVKLYDGKRDEFFAKLKEKANLSREDAEKKMQQLEKDSGCASAAKAA